MKIKLYHGTSSNKLQSIKESGFLDSPYLTSSLEQADYYAECVAEEDDSDMQILIVEIDTDHLRADRPSYDEPLSYILNEHGMSEEEWHEAIENDEIPYPAPNDWETSLQYVFSVKATQAIALKDIIFEQDSDMIVDDYQSVMAKKTKIKP